MNCISLHSILKIIPGADLWKEAQGVFSNISHTGMCRPKGYGFGPIQSENGIEFTHFGVESGMIFEGPTGVYERNFHFNSK